MTRRTMTAATAVALGLGLLVSGCSSPQAAPAADAEQTPAFAESAHSNSRLAVTYDGGILVLDGTSLEVLSDDELEGFTRVNPAGDDRHFLVSTAEGFQVLDAGAYTEHHDGHAHHYLGEAQLTEHAFPAVEPGHVVPHGDVTALFADGTGEVTFIDPSELDSGDAVVDSLQLPDAHHGVAVRLLDGTTLTTEGTHDERASVVALDAEGAESARTDDCTGVHGEAMAADEVAVFGCEDGVIVYRDGAFNKIASPDAYGRIGNQRGTDDSSIVLGDYKSDPDAELERPTRIALIDTDALSLRLVELGTSYTFRSLARGPEGAALVLGTDGAIHVIDPVSGDITGNIPVLGEWTEPDDWQEARPSIVVLGGIAYVSEPAASNIHVVDLTSLEVIDTVELDVMPNELAAVAG